MCYSGKCSFETFDGGCYVKNYARFKEEIGEPACLVGGLPSSKEEAIYMNDNRDRLIGLRKIAEDKGLIYTYRKVMKDDKDWLAEWL